MSYVEDVVAGVEQDTKRAVAVYYAIRDGILYDPYSADISVAGLKATTEFYLHTFLLMGSTVRSCG